MVQLPESAKEELETGSGMTIEEAMQIKCTPWDIQRAYSGKPGTDGEEGINALIWYAEGYRGRRQELRKSKTALKSRQKAHSLGRKEPAIYTYEPKFNISDS